MFEEFVPFRPLFLVALVVVIVWNLFHAMRAVLAWRAKKPLDAALYAYLAVGYLWPTSLIAKVLVVGPDWFRWHAGDIGFVLMLPAYIKLSMSVPPRRVDASEPISSVYRRTIDNLKIAKIMVFIMTVIIIGYEILTGVLYSIRPDIEPIGVGSFDPIDVAMYVLGAFIGAKLLNTMVDQFDKLAVAHEAREVAAANLQRAEQRKNRARPKKSRKHHNPSRR